MLQRSRRPKTAESSTRSCSGWPSSCSFNGAAVRRRRRVPHQVVGGVDLERASTEPPSEDGGEAIVNKRDPQEVALLQRSRRPKTAERAHDHGAAERRTRCFNGAAVRRRRRVHPDFGEDKRRTVLQRSRRPKTAERRGRHQGRRRGHQASTEPPSEDGGELASGAGALSARIMLQRSRRPKTAERSQPCRGVALDAHRFNGAAVRRRRREAPRSRARL